MAKRVPAKSRKRPLSDAEIEKILDGHYQPKRHSDGAVPWQFALADYCVRFSEKSRGAWGIYLRDYNVCVATFAPNSAALRDALTKMFDAAQALSKSWKAVERRIKEDMLIRLPHTNVETY